MVVHYSNTRTVQIARFPEIAQILTQHYSSLGRHEIAASRKSLEIEAYSMTISQEPIRSENLYEYQFLAAPIHHESKNSGGSIALKFEV